MGIIKFGNCVFQLAKGICFPIEYKLFLPFWKYTSHLQF